MNIDLKAGDEVRVKKPGLKFTRVIEGKILSLDAAAGVATVALEDNSVATKVPVAQIERKGTATLRAKAAFGSIASQSGF